MKIYTKTGDTGTTGLFGGGRVSKSHYRVEAYGTVDELNACIGMVRDQEVNQKRKAILVDIQNHLFSIGADMATAHDAGKAKIPKLSEEYITQLENEIDQMEETLPAMRHFILPGGHVSVSFCHMARCVCRRAERLSVALDQKEAVDPLAIKYLNRLSDYLFVLSRKMSQELGVEEIPWKPSKH
jgi:cob(I)alamin adenosyltransferase